MPTALPEALATYFEAIDANRSREAISCFSPDAHFVAPNASRETGPRVTLRGDAIAEMLRQRPVPTWTHEINIALNDGHCWFIEGGLKPFGESGHSATFVAEVLMDECDRIDRFAAFRTVPAVPPLQDGGPGRSMRVVSVMEELCAKTRSDSAVGRGPASGVSLLPGMRARAHLAGSSVGACVGVASHPDNLEQFVDFALEIALGPSGQPDRLVLFWAETAGPAE